MSDIGDREIKAFGNIEVKNLVGDAVKQSTKEAVTEVLELFGVDVANPRETQADMHYLRKLRTGAKRVESHIANSAIWAFVCAVAYLVYLGGKLWISEVMMK